jgi:adenylate kinase family enzyme
MLEFEQTGKLMSCDTVAFFLFKEMRAKGWNKNVFLIDGFIKAVAGFHYWMDQINDQLELKFVLYLECGAECMLKRMNVRSETSGRLDDNESIFHTRIKTFYKRTLPAIELLAALGIVVKVNTEEEMEKVYSKIREAFFKFFPEFQY